MNTKPFFIAILLSLALAAPALASKKDEIAINGSTTVLPVIQKAAENFMGINPDVAIIISGGGSGKGIKALTDGLCQIAMSSRDMRANEREFAQSRGVNPVRIPVAVDALMPIVHPSNSVADISVEQLRDIYAGRITNWRELGGADKRIAVLNRDTSSGTFEIWDEKVMNKERILPRAQQQVSNGLMVQTVAKNPHAIGYIGFGYLDRSVKSLDIGGLKASPENALAGQWPIARELYVFTNGEPQGSTKKLIDYLLDPQKGQKAVLEVGFIPLSTK